MPDQPSGATPSWYKGASSDWGESTNPVTDSLKIASDPKAAIQNLLRATVGGGGATSKDQPTTNWGDFIKSIVTDAASQAPLAMIPEGGAGMTAARGLASLVSGTTADQLTQPKKPLADSLVDSLLNTGVGMGIPHVLANETKFSPPKIAGTGASALPLKLLQLISPSSYQSATRTTMRGTTMGPKAVPDNIGIQLSNKLFTATNGQVDLSPKAILNLFGFGANTAVDSTVNRPKGESPNQ